MKKLFFVLFAVGLASFAVFACSTSAKIRGPRGLATKPEAQVRLQHAMAKLRRGEALSVAALGGSITTGFQAAQPATKGWAGLVASWWQSKAEEQGAEFTFHNAGISGTDSAFASVRVQDHVLAFEPDVVFVEFAMNDQWLNKKVSKRSFEGVVRHLLADSERALALVAINERGGPDKSNRAEEEQIAKHYMVPMLAWADWERDGDIPSYYNGGETIHPNTAGHANIAAGIIAYLEAIWDALPPDSDIPAIDTALPPPLVSDEFQFVKYIGWEDAADEDLILESAGWSEGSELHNEWASRGSPQKEGWTTDKTDAELQIAVQGKAVGILFTENSLYRNGLAWVTYADGTESPRVMINCSVSYRVGYFGWAYAEVADNLREGAVLHVVLAPGSPGQKTNVNGIVCTGVK